MNKKRAVIIRANLLDRETRATKIIRTLTENNYLVTLLCWDRGIKTSRSERKEAGNFYDEIQLKFKAPWGSKILFFLPVWWLFIFFKLMVIKWDIVHAIQIISLPPAVVAAKLKRKPVLYDMLDVYEDSISLPKIIRELCVKIDRIFMWLADGVILADEEQCEEVGGIPNSKIVPIYDSPSSVVDLNLKHQKNEVFTLFFVGSLDSGKKLNLDKIFEAIKPIDEIKLIIGGYGNLVDEINTWVRQMPQKVEFIGEIPHSEVIERSAKADLLFVLRDPVLLVNKYICGSKVLEAMMCGTPILVNKDTSTANKVLRENCGLIVDAKNVEEIKNAILKLKNDSNLCKKLGDNARRAYDEKYDWKIMEKKLLRLYQDL